MEDKKIKMVAAQLIGQQVANCVAQKNTARTPQHQARLNRKMHKAPVFSHVCPLLAQPPINNR